PADIALVLGRQFGFLIGTPISLHAYLGNPGLTGWRQHRYRYPETVLEVKARAPALDLPFLSRFSLRPVAFSKYVNGIDGLLGEN
ncbi:MAG: hypothetical protein CL878_11130, partial [Dehalococcoidia bacterium]|nr:hypothetical protein [Dehalococcoidia bacterium]